MKSLPAVDRPAGEEAHRKVERAPPGIDRRRAATIRGTQCREHERRLRRGREIRHDLSGVVGCVLRRPRRAASSSASPAVSVDLDRAAERSYRSEHLAVTAATGRSGVSGDRFDATVAVLDDRLVATAGRARPRSRPTRPAPAAGVSPNPARSGEVRRVEAAARAGPVPPPACPRPACAHEASHRSHTTTHTEAQATRDFMHAR